MRGHFCHDPRRLVEQYRARVERRVQIIDARQRLQPELGAAFVLAGEPGFTIFLQLLLPLREVQRDRLAVDVFLERGILLLQVIEVRIVGFEANLICPEHRDFVVERCGRAEARRLYPVPRHRGGPRVLADRIDVDERRQLDVGNDAAVLGALPGYAIVLADRQRQLTVILAAHDAVQIE